MRRIVRTTFGTMNFLDMCLKAFEHLVFWPSVNATPSLPAMHSVSSNNAEAQRRFRALFGEKRATLAHLFGFS
jgi:hypothetical protein